MESIKERRKKLLAENREYRKSLTGDIEDICIKSNDYLVDVIVPQIKELENECEQTGHVNLEIVTREEDSSKYYICDECRKLIELGY